MEICGDGVNKGPCVHVVSWLEPIPMDGKGQVFGHDPVHIDRIKSGPFQGLGKVEQFVLFVQMSTMDETPSPSKDTGNGIGACFAALSTDPR